MGEPKGSGETRRASEGLPRAKDRATHWRRYLRWPGKSVGAIAQLLGVDGGDPGDLEPGVAEDSEARGGRDKPAVAKGSLASRHDCDFFCINIYLEPPCPQKSREVTRKSGFETWQVEKPGFCSENRVLTPGPHVPRFSTLSIMFDKISTLTQSEHLPVFLGGSISHK